MERKTIGLVSVLIAIATIVILVVSYQPGVTPAPHYEATGVVTQVVDGDTITVWLTWVNESIEGIKAETDETVRFAGGVDSPELVVEGGPEAGNFTIELCPLWTEVYLDLDDLAESLTGRPYRGRYERLIATIYRKEDGNWVNVNAELLRWGLEAYPDHDWLKYENITSEFDADEWLAENYPYTRSFPSENAGVRFLLRLMPVIAIIAAAMTIAVYMVYRSKTKIDKNLVSARSTENTPSGPPLAFTKEPHR